MKRFTFRSAFFSPRVLIALLLCAAGGSSIVSGTLLAFFYPEAPTKDAKRTLTLEERVAYQRAIEKVYWRHRIWPKENLSSKPSLDAVMSQSQLEKKVTDYLRKSQALADYWQRPVTAQQLQSEMDRMAQNTRQPEVLPELFEALGNDPFVIAECLARPILAERLLAHSEFERAKQQSRTFDPTIAASANYILPRISGPSGGCIEDTWTPTNLTGAPDARWLHSAVWTGSEMIIWGGAGDFYFNSGGRYIPATDSWTAMSVIGAPIARINHTAVWTGNEMIVWGGFFAGYLNTGGRYNPITDSWTTTSTSGAPAGRSHHTAVWTGDQMIVWGGSDDTSYWDTGGRYNPGTNTWTATNTTNAPVGRSGHRVVWTGGQMIVWGGSDGSNYLNTGGTYSPGIDTWSATTTSGAPTGRTVPTAVWTGSQMIVWGGYNSNIGYLNTGGRYSPTTNTWTATNTSNAPIGRVDHAAVWTDNEMIVWGGDFWDSSDHYLNTGGRYQPGTDSWTTTSIVGAPDGRGSHTAVWTGSEMIIWGGNDVSSFFNTGGRYCAQGGPTPTPTPTPTPCTGRCSPTPRPRPTPHPRPASP